MLKKGFLVLVPLLAAAGPIALFSAPKWLSDVSGSVSRSGSTQKQSGFSAFIPGSSSGGTDAAATPAAEGPLLDVPAYDLADVFRFDLSPDSVVARWPRVSSGLAYLELQGYRVPLVTGTAEDDVAGALTYYFNPRQQVQRITFQGTTGNAGRLVSHVTSRFGLARQRINDAGVFLYVIPRPDGRATSFLWIRPAPIVKANDPLRRFEVAMVLERPENR